MQRFISIIFSIIIVFFLTLCFGHSVSANSNYIIDNYDVNIEIDQNNFYKVTENIDVEFTNYQLVSIVIFLIVIIIKQFLKTRHMIIHNFLSRLKTSRLKTRN